MPAPTNMKPGNFAPKKILTISLYPRESSDSAQQINGKLCFTSFSLGTERTVFMLIRSFLIPKRLSKFDVIVTSNYFSAFAISLRLLLTFCRTKHVAVSLNQSRRLFKTSVEIVDRLIDFVFRRCDLVVVHSRKEMELFGQSHHLPKSKFMFSHWGFDLPEITPSEFSQWRKRYICLVGRNNRDIRTFAKALDGMDVDGVVVTSRYEIVPNELPENVFVFRDLPLNDTLDCISNAQANLILLKDNERGAGHITAVAAMFAATPQIVSDADVIKDYVIDGVTGIIVPLNDVAATRAAMERLLSDPELASALTTNAQKYAACWLTYEATSRRIFSALEKVARDEKVVPVDPIWQSVYDDLRRSGGVRIL